MNTVKFWIAALTAIVLLLSASGCAVTGKVEQGRVIAYDKKTATVTLIPESLSEPVPGVLPPISVKTPVDPDEMGPAPVPGKLMKLDRKLRRFVVYDAAAQSFRTIEYTPITEQKATKAPKSLVDRVKKTITIYSKDQQIAITFEGTDELLAMPDDTWRSGDIVRYFYEDPSQALRLMNVTRTDLTKSGG